MRQTPLARDIREAVVARSRRPVSVEILWGESRRLIWFGFGTVTVERPMLQENEGTISTQDQPTGSDIFVSVEMSRSKWVVGIHTPLANKIGLHTMACGDVEALLALIDRARVKLVASGSNSPAAMICYEAGYEGFWLYRRLVALGIRVVVRSNGISWPEGQGDEPFDRLKVDTEVAFAEEEGVKGPQASTVRVVGGRRRA
jgi:hypothetical protein